MSIISTKPRRARCKECREWFFPQYSNVTWCCPEHGKALAGRLNDKKREKQKAKLNEASIKTPATVRCISKPSVKPRSRWLEVAQQAINQYVREVEKDLRCISCGTYDTPRWDAGHYRSIGAAPQLRFTLLNIHKQCIECNQLKSANSALYRTNLIQLIGLPAVEALENDHSRHPWTITECKEIAVEYRAKLKALKLSVVTE